MSRLLITRRLADDSRNSLCISGLRSKANLKTRDIVSQLFPMGELRMEIENLGDDELNTSAIGTASGQREMTAFLLRHLVEIQKRRLFSKYGCDSLHGYCRKVLSMCDPEAGRHVAAAKLLRDFPVIDEKFQAGTLSLTSLNQTQVFINREKKNGNVISKEEKLALINAVDGQSTRAVDKILVSKSKLEVQPVKEVVRLVAPELSRATIGLDEETREHLDRLKEIWSHSMPGANYTDIIKRMARETRERLDPMKKAERAKTKKEKKASSRNTSPVTVKDRRAMTPARDFFRPANREDIPAATHHALYLRDTGSCTFIDPETGERCGSRHFLQPDHIIPVARGGSNDLENLRLRCFAHNQRHAIDCFGEEVLRYAEVEREL
ncbi:MAG: HNH endonuclease signature motif containing protein [Bdellovibrionota bacterium]